MSSKDPRDGWHRPGAWTTLVEADVSERTCVDASCERPVKHRGMCGMHYARWRRSDPNRPRCARKDCERPAVTRKLCSTHYQQEPDQQERHRQASWVWWSENRERSAENVRAWIAAHPDKAREHRRNAMRVWRARNPETAAEKIRQWAEANPERWAELRKQASQARRARVLGTQTEPVDLTRVLAEHGMFCHLCERDIADGELHFDHIIPLARGGSHTYDNLRPAHAACNLKKGCRVD